MGKRYLLTGASGFLGKHIKSYLQRAGDAVVTLGRDASNDIISDLSAAIPQVNQHFDTVIHAAGKAHMVPRTEEEKQAFFEVNLQGTKHLCQALGQSPPASFIFISTVAVYGKDEGDAISESHPLNGDTPYAVSKIEAERYLQQWCADHQVVLTILRLPLIAGEHPPGNLGAMIQGIRKGRYFNIDGGKAAKSIVLADDVAACIPVVAPIGGIYNLTDGQHPTFAALADLIARQAGKGKQKNMPLWLARLMAKAGDLLGDKAPINTAKLNKIIATLTFDDHKARAAFGWSPNSVLEKFSIQ